MGILLVVNSSRGHQLAFRYPLVMPSDQSSDEDDDPQMHEILVRGEDGHNHRRLPSGTASPHNQKFGFIRDLNAVFNAPRDKSVTDTFAEAEVPDVRAVDSSYLGFTPQFLSNLLTPKCRLCNQKFHLSIDQVSFIGHPVMLGTNVDNTATSTAPTSPVATHAPSAVSLSRPPGEDNHTQSMTLFDIYLPHRSTTSDNVTREDPMLITMFHPVIVVLKDESSPDFEAYAEFLYQHVVHKLARMLEMHQLVDEYVRKEVELITQLRSQSTALQDDHKAVLALQKKLVAESSLARSFQEIYFALRSDQVAHVSLDSHCQLALRPFSPTQLLDIERTIKPFYSIMFRFDVTEIIKHLSPDANPLIRQIVRTATSRKSLDDTKRKLNISWDVMKRLVAHLVLWKKCILIYPISLDNTYIFAQDSKKDKKAAPLQLIAREIGANFPSVDCGQLFAHFSGTPQPLSTCIPSQNEELKVTYLEAASMMLYYRVIQQLHTYVRFWPADNNIDGTFFGQDLIIAAQALATTHDRTIGNMLIRILPYLNGQFSVEQIAWQEHLSRREIMHIVDIFQEHLVICRYTDDIMSII